MTYLRQYIESMIPIDDADWQKVTALFTRREYARGDMIFSAGEICQKVHYVSSGVARIYSISTEGKDLTMGLNYNRDGIRLDLFCADYVSYLTQTESNFFGEALDACVVYEANFVALDALYESEMKWMKLARKISEGQLITIAQRVQMTYRLTAKEKYELMKQIDPVYEEVLPDYQYATVLGITPQSLSRIKNR